MEPVSAFAVGYVTDKLVDAVESAIKVHVVERWSRYRAKQFFQAFVLGLAEGGLSFEEINLKLDELLESDDRSEVVWEAYRSVCLAKSKNIGPRIIAILTAELILQGRQADTEEESMFGAAESLSDSEFMDFADYADEKKKLANDSDMADVISTDEGTIDVKIMQESTDSFWRKSSLNVGPANLALEVGSWAEKLKSLGLVSDSIVERQWNYEADSERHIDEDGIVREITWWIELKTGAMRLADLVNRTVQADPI